MITAEEVANSLMAGNVIQDKAVAHPAGLMEQVGEILKAKGFELRHESDVYTVKGQAKALAAKTAKDAADKAAVAAKEAAAKAATAKVVADQAAVAAKAAAQPVAAPTTGTE
jgi:hypothetical protein